MFQNSCFLLIRSSNITTDTLLSPIYFASSIIKLNKKTMSEKTGIYPHPPPDYTTSPPPSFQSGPGMASHITVQPGVIPNQSSESPC